MDREERWPQRSLRESVAVGFGWGRNPPGRAVPPGRDTRVCSGEARPTVTACIQIAQLPSDGAKHGFGRGEEGAGSTTGTTMARCRGTSSQSEGLVGDGFTVRVAKSEKSESASALVSAACSTKKMVQRTGVLDFLLA